MKRQLRIVLLGLWLVGVAAQAPAIQARDVPSEATFSGDFPVVSGKGSLTVSGNGYHHRELYEDGDVPTLTARDSEGGLLPDGIYRFQFISTPEGADRSWRQRDVLRGGATGSDSNAPTGATRVSGTFEVLGGHLEYR